MEFEYLSTSAHACKVQEGYAGRRDDVPAAAPAQGLNLDHGRRGLGALVVATQPCGLIGLMGPFAQRQYSVYC